MNSLNGEVSGRRTSSLLMMVIMVLSTLSFGLNGVAAEEEPMNYELLVTTWNETKESNDILDGLDLLGCNWIDIQLWNATWYYSDDPWSMNEDFDGNENHSFGFTLAETGNYSFVLEPGEYYVTGRVRCDNGEVHLAGVDTSSNWDVANLVSDNYSIDLVTLWHYEWEQSSSYLSGTLTEMLGENLSDCEEVKVEIWNVNDYEMEMLVDGVRDENYRYNSPMHEYVGWNGTNWVWNASYLRSDTYVVMVRGWCSGDYLLGWAGNESEPTEYTVDGTSQSGYDNVDMTITLLLPESYTTSSISGVVSGQELSGCEQLQVELWRSSEWWREYNQDGHGDADSRHAGTDRDQQYWDISDGSEEYYFHRVSNGTYVIQAVARCGSDLWIGVLGGNHSSPVELVVGWDHAYDDQNITLDWQIQNAIGTSRIEGRVSLPTETECDWVEVELWLASAYYDEMQYDDGGHVDRDHWWGNNGEVSPVHQYTEWSIHQYGSDQIGFEYSFNELEVTDATMGGYVVLARGACEGDYILGVTGGNVSAPTELVITSSGTTLSDVNITLSDVYEDQYGIAEVHGYVSDLSSCEELKVEAWTIESYWREYNSTDEWNRGQGDNGLIDWDWDTDRWNRTHNMRQHWGDWNEEWDSNHFGRIHNLFEVEYVFVAVAQCDGDLLAGVSGGSWDSPIVVTPSGDESLWVNITLTDLVVNAYPPVDGEISVSNTSRETCENYQFEFYTLQAWMRELDEGNLSEDWYVDGMNVSSHREHPGWFNWDDDTEFTIRFDDWLYHEEYVLVVRASCQGDYHMGVSGGDWADPTTINVTNTNQFQANITLDLVVEDAYHWEPPGQITLEGAISWDAGYVSGIESLRDCHRVELLLFAPNDWQRIVDAGADLPQDYWRVDRWPAQQWDDYRHEQNDPWNYNIGGVYDGEYILVGYAKCERGVTAIGAHGGLDNPTVLNLVNETPYYQNVDIELERAIDEDKGHISGNIDLGITWSESVCEDEEVVVELWDWGDFNDELTLGSIGVRNHSTDPMRVYQEWVDWGDRTTNNGRGQYHFGGLPSGDYSVVARWSCGGTIRYAYLDDATGNAEQQQVDEDQGIEGADLYLDRLRDDPEWGNGSISGTITWPNWGNMGQDSADWEVIAVAFWWTDRTDLFMDEKEGAEPIREFVSENGASSTNYIIENLPDGDYIVFFAAEEMHDGDAGGNEGGHDEGDGMPPWLGGYGSFLCPSKVTVSGESEVAGVGGVIEEAPVTLSGDGPQIERLSAVVEPNNQFNLLEISMQVELSSELLELFDSVLFGGNCDDTLDVEEREKMLEKFTPSDEEEAEGHGGRNSEGDREHDDGPNFLVDGNPSTGEGEWSSELDIQSGTTISTYTDALTLIWTSTLEYSNTNTNLAAHIISFGDIDADEVMVREGPDEDRHLISPSGWLIDGVSGDERIASLVEVSSDDYEAWYNVTDGGWDGPLQVTFVEEGDPSQPQQPYATVSIRQPQGEVYEGEVAVLVDVATNSNGTLTVECLYGNTLLDSISWMLTGSATSLTWSCDLTDEEPGQYEILATYVTENGTQLGSDSKMVTKPEPPEPPTARIILILDGVSTVLTPQSDGQYYIDMMARENYLFEVEGLSGFSGALEGGLNINGTEVAQLENIPGSTIRRLSYTPVSAGAVDAQIHLRDVSGTELDLYLVFSVSDPSGGGGGSEDDTTTGGFVPGFTPLLVLLTLLGTAVILRKQRIAV